jgi:hypothetical protein
MSTPSEGGPAPTEAAARDLLDQYRRRAATPSLPSSTRPVDPALSELLGRMQPGQRIRITQTVRVGLKQWTTTVIGKFRGVNFLATGLATHRVKEDDIVVVAVHFLKDNGELSSITIDEHTRIEALEL